MWKPLLGLSFAASILIVSNTLQSYMAYNECIKSVQASQIFLHLITIGFLSKLVWSVWNWNSSSLGDCDRYQLLFLITSYHADETSLTSWKVNPKTTQTMQQLEGKVATSPAFILQHISFHICQQSSEWGAEKGPSHVGFKDLRFYNMISIHHG